MKSCLSGRDLLFDLTWFQIVYTYTYRNKFFSFLIIFKVPTTLLLGHKKKRLILCICCNRDLAASIVNALFVFSMAAVGGGFGMAGSSKNKKSNF